jgi:opacity protein-like surface antigen
MIFTSDHVLNLMVMKKYICTVLALALTLGITAQTISMGPTATIGNSWLSTDRNLAPGSGDKALHVAYSIGARMVYSFVDHWGVSSDLNFSSEGGSFKNDVDDLKYVYRVNYLRYSHQINYFFGRLGDRIRPKLSAGPSVAIFAGGSTRVKNSGTIEAGSESSSKNLFKTWDFGLTGAAGVNFRIMNNIWLNAEGNYYHGLLDVNDVNDNNLRNRRLGFTVGVLMGCDFSKYHQNKK